MNTLLLQKAYSLYCSLSELTGQFPKRDRYGLGLRLENNCLALIEAIITAEQGVAVLKDRALLEAGTKKEIIKLMLRLAVEKKLIGETNYFTFSARITEIGKMIGGWRKSLRR